MIEKPPLPPAELWDAAPFFDCLGMCRGHVIAVNGLRHYYWHQLLQERHSLHPSVELMLKYKPLDYVKLALEWPHVSASDPTRLAYTRNVPDGENERQLVTSVGKYLARHWPHVEDHLRRDVQALFTPDKMCFVHTLPEIIGGVEFGPRSCMASVAGYIGIRWGEDAIKQHKIWSQDPTQEAPDWSRHPYSAYDPQHGWHMALRKNGSGRIDGRALCLDFQQKKTFVRTYQRHRTDPAGWSETDFSLQAWLVAQGYSLEGYWPEGVMFTTRVDDDGSLRAPYMDGNERRVVRVPGGLFTKLVHKKGEFVCEYTSGICSPSDHNSDDDDDEDDNGDQLRCNCCDDYFDPDDLSSVGRSGDDLVCDSCGDENYRWVHGLGSLGRNCEYFLHENNTCFIKSNDCYIDEDHPPTWAVCLADGGWEHEDEVVRVGDEYYAAHDSNIVNLAEPDPNTGSDYGLRRQCYLDEETATWWASKADFLEHNPPDEDDDETEAETQTVAETTSP